MQGTNISMEFGGDFDGDFCNKVCTNRFFDRSIAQIYFAALISLAVQYKVVNTTIDESRSYRKELD